MKTPADILRELGKLGPYTPPLSTLDSGEVEPAKLDEDEPPAEPPRRRPRKHLPPVDF